MAAGQRTYRIHEFATLSGVSVRALHHYDRLGLLKPRRSASGYRLYVDADIAVLEQIVALKFIGVPLRDVKRLLRTAPDEFQKVLAAQRALLEEKRRRLNLAIAAIRQALDVDVGKPAALKHIIEVIEMQDNQDNVKKQYAALLQGKIERLSALSPEAREQMRRQFSDLCQEIAGALDQDPAGPRAQELAGRWLQLLAAFSPLGAVDPQLLKYGSAAGAEGTWPAGATRAEPPFGKPVWEFMAKAVAARPSKRP